MEGNGHRKGWDFWGEGWSRFGAFGVIGGLLILALHFFFPQARLLIAGFAFLLMVAFGWSEWRYKVGQEDRLGDDLYYLGLTYTLVSVVHALWAFAGVVDVNRLVSDFSVALFTTLAGIVGRVLLYEKHASQNSAVDVDDSMARLRIEIEGAVQQFQEFRHGLAFHVQQEADRALGSMNATLTAFSASATEMGEAAKAVNASLKKGVTAFDKSFGRIGETSDTLRAHVSELAESTKSLGAASEALNRSAVSVNASLEQQSRTLAGTLEAQKEATEQTRIKLESLNRPVDSLTRSIDQMRQQIDTARQDFTSTQLKTSIADAREAADILGRNIRSAANALSPDSVGSSLSAFNAFASAISNLTTKVDECTRKLAEIAIQPENGYRRPPAPDFVSSEARSPYDARAGGYSVPITRAPNNESVPSTRKPSGPETSPPAEENKQISDRYSTRDNRPWWSWRRG